MNHHRQHPYMAERVERREPSTLAIWCGAALAVLFTWAACFVAFAL